MFAFCVKMVDQRRIWLLKPSVPNIMQDHDQIWVIRNEHCLCTNSTLMFVMIHRLCPSRNKWSHFEQKVELMGLNMVWGWKLMIWRIVPIRFSFYFPKDQRLLHQPSSNEPDTEWGRIRHLSRKYTDYADCLCRVQVSRWWWWKWRRGAGQTCGWTMHSCVSMGKRRTVLHFGHEYKVWSVFMQEKGFVHPWHLESITFCVDT